VYRETEFNRDQLQHVLDGLEMLAHFEKDLDTKKNIETTRKLITARLDQTTDEIPENAKNVTVSMIFRITSKWSR
jgi:hypothetical protein